MEGSAKKSVPRSTSPKPKKKGVSDSSPDVVQTRPRAGTSSNQEPTYYIGGGNGTAIVEEVMNGMGWKRTKDKTDESVRLRWCELKSGINYGIFREGEQMVNRIPNGSLLTNKLGLLNSLQEHSRISNTIQKRPVSLDFLPETYRLDDPKDRDAFTKVFKDNEIWICKPTGRNQGKGIFLVRTIDDLNQSGGDNEEASQQNQQQGKPQKPLNRIIQRYIMNPLLLEGRKFDIRCYMLLASTVPMLVLYHRGYCRLSMYEYDNSCENIIAHLTNQFIQKRDPQYAAVKEETAWSMDRFNEYINETVAPNKGLAKDWVYGHLTKTMKQIMVQCINAVKNKLQCKLGYFDMFGFDFLIDEDMKIWLIEVNVNPCLATNCEALRERVPGVVSEALHLAIECFEKGRRNRPLLPLQALKEFEIIFDGGAGKSSGGGGSSPTRSTAQSGRGSSDRQSAPRSPLRRARSMSPVKETSSGPAREPVKPRPSQGTGSKPTPTSTADQSPPVGGAKKSTKNGSAETTAPIEQDSGDTGTNSAVKRTRRTKPTDETKTDVITGEDTGTVKSKQNGEMSSGDRNKLQSRALVEVRSSKSVSNVAKPAVAKQSTSSTVKEVQPRKKKTVDGSGTVDNATGGIESQDDNIASRGS